MGVYIKGMEMPTGCGKCACGAYGVCDAATPKKLLDKHYRWSAVKRPDWCPLVPVPPHGRLIDADALKDLYHYNTHDSDIDKACTCNIRRSIDSAPTIIPAEEGE